ncbi:MAG: hypothetical protein K8R21_03980, partial [Leptospira sp.]|nr:hypothetical protein [Leptospira sp.]
LYDDPISILDFVDEFEFNVYSNDSGGRFSFYLTDAEATQRKIFIGNLNYRGWKKFRVRMSGKVEQNDLVLNKPSPLQFVGFLYEPGRKIRKDREELICIDDVFAITRQKYHIIKNLDKLIE